MPGRASHVVRCKELGKARRITADLVISMNRPLSPSSPLIAFFVRPKNAIFAGVAVLLYPPNSAICADVPSSPRQSVRGDESVLGQ